MITTFDFETRSACDLRKHGAHVYAAHPTTEIMQLSAAVDEGPTCIWVPDKFKKLVNLKNIRYRFVNQDQMVDAILKSDEAWAHNSMFEYLIWNNVGARRHKFPPLPLEKLHDTMALAAYHALPFSLDQLSMALNLPIKKDAVGHAIMLKLCKPRKPRKAEREADPDWASKIWWNEDPRDLEALFNYGGTDVEAERLVRKTLSPLPPKEREIWLLDQKINLRGAPIDIENVKNIVKVVRAREIELRARFAKLTKGAVNTPKSYVALKNWVNELMGLNLASIDKNATDELLLRKDLPPTVREVLEIKKEISKASVAKFEAMLNQAVDGRVRDMFAYGGASTLRWAGRAVQLHNLPRDSYKPEMWEDVVSLFAENPEAISTLYDDPFFVASRCVRGAICTN